MQIRELVLLGLLGLSGCLDEPLDDEEYSETESAVSSENRLSANRLSANRLSANKLSAASFNGALASSNALVSNSDGREVLSYIVACALPSSASLTAVHAGTTYTFHGELGLAPAWSTRAPTGSERRWVTACVLARTNYYGVTVQLSMRGTHSALATTSTERSKYDLKEATFYGDMFGTGPQHMYACSSLPSGTPTPGTPRAQRVCAVSDDNSSTRCGFEYTGHCYNACDASGCDSNSTSWGSEIDETITVYLDY